MTQHKIQVFVVDDHNLVRDGIKELLKSNKGLECVGEAASGQEAINRIADVMPDIVLLDIALPDISGITVARTISEKYTSVTVLILTAYDNEDFIWAILETGASGYILKDAKGSELIHAIYTAHEGGSIFHPDIIKKIVEWKQSHQTTFQKKSKIELSDRECVVVELGSFGLTNQEIAFELSVSDRTIQTHWRNIFNKLGVSSRIEAIMMCIEKGLIHAPKSRD